MSEGPPLQGTVSSETKEAKEIASGGGIVFASSLVDRGLRLMITWLLSGFLGPEVFGLYTLCITIITLIKMFSPLGTELGTVYFGARFRQNKAQDELKGLIWSSVLLSTLSGVVFSIVTWFAAPLLVSDPLALRLTIPALLFWTPLHTIVGLLRARKDMRGNALVYQLSLPLCLVTSAWLVVLLRLDIYLALTAFCLSHGASLVYGIQRSWKHYGYLFRDSTINRKVNYTELLKYSIPMAFSQLVFRLNAWMDILMLGWLMGNQDVGVYKIAVSLAMIGGLPINAIITIFNPIIVELVNAGNLQKLNQLLKLVTRWLLLFTLPVLCSIFLLSDIVLLIFDDAYQVSQEPLKILILGQIVWGACSICMRLIPMSGYAMLNLANGVVAALVNISLNYWLIPKYGTLGAAMATAGTLALWSCWRLGEAWVLLKCFPFSAKIAAMIGSAAALTFLLNRALVSMTLADVAEWIRVLTVLFAWFVYVTTAWWLGREEADRQITNTIGRRFRRLLTKN